MGSAAVSSRSMSWRVLWSASSVAASSVAVSCASLPRAMPPPFRACLRQLPSTEVAPLPAGVAALRPAVVGVLTDEMADVEP